MQEKKKAAGKAARKWASLEVLDRKHLQNENHEQATDSK